MKKQNFRAIFYKSIEIVTLHVILQCFIITVLVQF